MIASIWREMMRLKSTKTCDLIDFMRAYAYVWPMTYKKRLKLSREERQDIITRALDHPDVVALKAQVVSKLAVLEGALLIQNKIIILQRRLLGLSFR